MFGPRTTVKKVRNSLTWFSQPSRIWIRADTSDGPQLSTCNLSVTSTSYRTSMSGICYFRAEQYWEAWQWACNRHSAHGSIQRYSTGWKAAHEELFHRCQGLLRTTVERFEPLPDSSLSHLDYGSKRYDTIRSVGLRSGTCYIIAEQYWEVCGTSINGICYIIAELYWVEPETPGVAQYDLNHCRM